MTTAFDADIDGKLDDILTQVIECEQEREEDDDYAERETHPAGLAESTGLSANSNSVS